MIDGPASRADGEAAADRAATAGAGVRDAAASERASAAGDEGSAAGARLKARAGAAARLGKIAGSPAFAAPAGAPREPTTFGRSNEILTWADAGDPAISRSAQARQDERRSLMPQV